MKKKAKPSSPADTALRHRAEAQWRAVAARDALQAPGDTQRLQQELQIHQIELEMQNEELRQARTALEASLDQYTNLYDFAPVGYFTLDREGVIRQVNLTGARLLGVERARLAGQRLSQYVAEADLPALEASLQRAFAQLVTATCEVALQTESEAPRFARLEAEATASGQECRLILIDITEQVHAQQVRQAAEVAVQAERDLALQMLNALPEGVLLLNPEWKIDYANPAIERQWGYPRADLLGRETLDFIHPDDRHIALEFRQQQLPGEISQATVRHRRADGSYEHDRVTRAPLRQDGQFRGAIVAVSDLSEMLQNAAALRQAHAQLEQRVSERTAELTAANAELRRLSRRLVAVQEDERRHLGRELHDEVGQSLTALLLMLDMPPTPAHERRAPLLQARTLALELADRVHDLSLDLRPSLLDDLGLLPTLAWHFQRYRTQTRVRVNFTHAGLGRRFPPEVETAAYRIVQEALTNVARHARTEAVTVAVWANADRLYVQIEDHGIGFVESEAQANLAAGGLSGMRERAALLNGELTITSLPGAGTTVLATLPL